MKMKMPKNDIIKIQSHTLAINKDPIHQIHFPNERDRRWILAFGRAIRYVGITS